MNTLSPTELEAALSELQDWHLDNDRLVKVLNLPLSAMR